MLLKGLFSRLSTGGGGDSKKNTISRSASNDLTNIRRVCETPKARGGTSHHKYEQRSESADKSLHKELGTNFITTSD